MNPITLDAIKLLLDMQSSSMASPEQKEEALNLVDKLLKFMGSDIDAVLEKNSKLLK